MKEITIATDFSKHPAGRFRTDGPYSGQLFREDFLDKIVNDREVTVIYLDGARGYGSSFLEEAFGGLARKFTPDLVESLIQLRSRDENLVRRIHLYIANANNAVKAKKSMLFGGGINARNSSK